VCDLPNLEAFLHPLARTRSTPGAGDRLLRKKCLKRSRKTAHIAGSNHGTSVSDDGG
jgi:hypothetical protein